MASRRTKEVRVVSVPPVDGGRWQQAGLFDPDAPDAAARLAVLEYLSQLGLTPEDVLDAAEHHRLGRLAADRILWQDAGPTLTTAEVGQQAGVDDATARALMRAAGIVERCEGTAFRESHAEFVRAFAAGQEMFGRDIILQFVRVLGSAASTIAEAAVGLFLTSVSPRLRESGVDDIERVRQSAEAVQSFMFVPTAMQVLLRDHFVTAVRRLGLLDVAEGGETSAVIAFVDLVGSTAFAHDASTPQLVDALVAFEGAALDAALVHDVRIVKHIGDEVMLVGRTASDVAGAVCRIMRFVVGQPAWRGARAGLAAGYAVTRDGDYFGPVVNTAARLAAVALANEVLVNDAAASALEGEGFSLDDAGEKLLRGFDRPVHVSRLRPDVESTVS